MLRLCEVETLDTIQHMHAPASMRRVHTDGSVVWYHIRTHGFNHVRLLYTVVIG